MSHSEHSPSEKKPVAFTVPFILASVTVVVILLFLSLCDPKPHHAGKCECKENCSKECMEACERGEGPNSHHEMKAGHKMNCGECKGECTEVCMEECKKGNHGKHAHQGHEGHAAPAAENPVSDSAVKTEPAPAH